MPKLKASLLLLCACGVSAPGPGLDTDRVLEHVDVLTEIGPRPGDSKASGRALAYLEGELERAGAKPARHAVGEVELPGIEVLGTRYRQARRARSEDPNLIVRFGPPGEPGEALLLMAHYDSVATSPGAVDNAVAVGTLIELGRVLSVGAPELPVILAFTANEERGLVGAEALAAELGAEVGLAIALDLTGGTGALSLNGAGERIGAAEMRWLADAADRAGVVVRAPLAHRVISRWWPQAERSDHGAFTRRGIRALHLYHRGHDGEWIDRAYHSERDDRSRVVRASVDELGRLVRALVASPLPAPTGDGFWVPVADNVVVPRWLVLALDLALAVAALVALGKLRAQPTRRGLGLLAATLCFAIAGGGAVLAERVIAGDHVAPWLHAPLPFTLGLSLVLAGALGLAVLAARRVRPWSGALRYVVLAVALLLAPGLALLALGAAELAWIWLGPAALLAVAAHTGPRLAIVRVVAVLLAALPLALVLNPHQLREAAWNGFLPTTIPLAAWLFVLGAPIALAVAWLVRRRTPLGPLGSLVLPVGCSLAILAGAGVASLAPTPCSGADFNEFHLACELPTRVR